MLASLILLLFITIACLFCIGLVGLSQNIPRSVRLYFSLAIIFLDGWMLCLYLSNITSPFVLIFNRAVYISPILGLFFLGQFSDVYYKRFAPLGLSRLGRVSLVAVVLGSVIGATSLNIVNVVPRMSGNEITGYSVVPGPLSLLVALCTLVLCVTLILRLYTAYRAARKDIKRPLRIILQALTFTVCVSIGTNLVLPLIGGGSDLGNALSSVSVMIFIISVTYSVLRYSFLDARLLVVRSVGYLAGLGLVLAAVSIVQIAIFNFIGTGSPKLDMTQQAALIVLFVLAALTFDPLRHLFGKATTRIFFRDGYDAGKFIARFNANLVKHISIEELLADSASAIEHALKPTFCVIGVGKTPNTPQYLIGSQHFTEHQAKVLMEVVFESREQVLLKQYSGTITRHGNALRGLFTDPDIEVIVKLIESVGDEQTTLGFVALGPKRTGEIYNVTDLETLRVVVNELELAVQNALRFEEIQRFNLTLQDEIDSATRKLKRQNKRLEELDNIKDDFISMASHQLRTPLTSVKGYLSMVLEGDAGKLNPTQTQMLKQAFTSSQRMVFLITDLLNVSRLKTGKFVIDRAPLNLANLIEDELDQLHETAAVKNIDLSFDRPKSFPDLMLDEVKTRQVIMNFLDNAIYYTPAGGHIRVELVDKPASVELRVVDDGIGVPKEEQHHLFTKFYRATNARKARPDGTGLGLFMAQKVIVAQGGTIIFSSKENRGSTFGFAFSKSRLAVPRRAVKAPAASAPVAEPPSVKTS